MECKHCSIVSFLSPDPDSLFLGPRTTAGPSLVRRWPVASPSLVRRWTIADPSLVCRWSVAGPSLNHRWSELSTKRHAIGSSVSAVPLKAHMGNLLVFNLSSPRDSSVEGLPRPTVCSGPTLHVTLDLPMKYKVECTLVCWVEFAACLLSTIGECRPRFALDLVSSGFPAHTKH